jgi:hypothetical protein
MAAVIVENSAHYSSIRNDRGESCRNRDRIDEGPWRGTLVWRRP